MNAMLLQVLDERRILHTAQAMPYAHRLQEPEGFPDTLRSRRLSRMCRSRQVVGGGIFESGDIWCDGEPGLIPRDVECHDCRSRSEERRVGKECRSRWSPY